MSKKDNSDRDLVREKLADSAMRDLKSNSPQSSYVPIKKKHPAWVIKYRGSVLLRSASESKECCTLVYCMVTGKSWEQLKLDGCECIKVEISEIESK